MRVLHVTECFGGGVGRALHARALATPDLEHHLLWAGEESPVSQACWNTTKKLPDGTWQRIRATRDHVADLQPDIVHAHSSWAGVYTRVLRLPVPVLYEPHCFKFDDPASSAPARFAFRMAERVLARNSSVIGVLSPHEERLARALHKGVATVFLPNTPTLDAAAIGRSGATRPGTAPATQGVVTVGRVSPQKDPLYFIQVVQRLRTAHPDLKAWWVGDGDPWLTSELEQAGVIVTGWQTASGVSKLLSQASVYIHTARYEGFPLSILDAALMGCPIAARSIAPFESTGLLQRDTPEQLAVLASQLMTDPEARSSAQRTSAILLERMNTDALTQALGNAYHSLQAGSI